MTPCDVTRFVNSETIREYVSADQLLAQFGGTDPWQFDYEREREVMLEQLQIVLERGGREEEEEERENGHLQSTEVGRQGNGRGCYVVVAMLWLRLIPVTWS